jgi:hypothetical protein
VYRNVQNEATQKTRIYLISKEEWKQYCKEKLVYEEETFRSEAIYAEVYNAINMVDLDGALSRSEYRKAPGLDGNNNELLKTRENVAITDIQLFNDEWNIGRTAIDLGS